MEGIEKMVAEDVFRTLANNAFDGEGCSTDDTAVSVAIFEIYGGRVQDLLNDRRRLKVLEDGRGEAVVAGLEEFCARDPAAFLALIERGQRHRTTHATEANDVSSRSHAVCQINFRDARGGLRGKLSLVDLAGSERGSDTKSHDRQRRAESADINTSLLALKECIRAIDGDSRHVPYRQSKLTLILKDCFVSRAARTAMIATVSPGSMSTDHTVNTLRYADRIKEKKVDDFISSSGRSPLRPSGPLNKASAVPGRAASREPGAEQHDDFDELDEIINAPDASVQNAAAASPATDDDPGERLSALDRTVKELLEEEEHLLNLHMTNIQENASLLSEETSMLASIQDDEENDIDRYASRLGDILDQKTGLIHSLQDRLGLFRELLRREEELSTLH